MRIPISGTVGLFKQDNSRDYEMAGSVGLGAGYHAISTPSQQLEVGFEAGCPFETRWHYVYYDLGVRYGYGASHTWSPYLGVGMKYFDSYSGNVKNYCTFYLAIGIQLNLYKNK